MSRLGVDRGVPVDPVCAPDLEGQSFDWRRGKGLGDGCHQRASIAGGSERPGPRPVPEIRSGHLDPVNEVGRPPYRGPFEDRESVDLPVRLPTWSRDRPGDHETIMEVHRRVDLPLDPGLQVGQGDSPVNSHSVSEPSTSPTASNWPSWDTSTLGPSTVDAIPNWGNSSHDSPSGDRKTRTSPNPTLSIWYRYSPSQICDRRSTTSRARSGPVSTQGEDEAGPMSRIGCRSVSAAGDTVSVEGGDARVVEVEPPPGASDANVIEPELPHAPRSITKLSSMTLRTPPRYPRDRTRPPPQVASGRDPR